MILALTNPDPEIAPTVALEAGAAFAADGTSVNNVLGFPGIFRGALMVGADEISTGMKLAAARAIAGLTKEAELVPDALDPAVHAEVAAAVVGSRPRRGPRPPRARALRPLTGRTSLAGVYSAHSGTFGGQSAGPGEDRVEHRLRQLARERVLLARVERADERVGADRRLRRVAEPRLRLRGRMAAPRTARAAPRPTRTTPRQTITRTRVSSASSSHQIRNALVALDRGRLVGRRRAAHDGADVRAVELEPVAGVNARPADSRGPPGAAPRRATRPSGRR